MRLAVVTWFIGSLASAQESAPRALATGDVRLRYDIVGSGPDTVLVVPAAWLQQGMARLADRYTLILLHPRGRGASSTPADSSGYGWQRDVRDVETLRRELGLGRFAFLGWRYDAAVGALYAAQFPGRLSRLVMLSPAPLDPAGRGGLLRQSQRGADTAALQALASLRRVGADAADPSGYCRMDLFARVLPALVVDQDVAARFRDDPCQYANEWPHRAAVIAQLIARANQRWSWRGYAARTSTTTLVIHGLEDPVVPASHAREWTRLMPESRLLLLQRVGHLAWLEAESLVLDALTTFLQGDWPRGAQSIPHRGSR